MSFILSRKKQETQKHKRLSRQGPSYIIDEKNIRNQTNTTSCCTECSGTGLSISLYCASLSFSHWLLNFSCPVTVSDFEFPAPIPCWSAKSPRHCSITKWMCHVCPCQQLWSLHWLYRPGHVCSPKIALWCEGAIRHINIHGLTWIVQNHLIKEASCVSHRLRWSLYWLLFWSLHFACHHASLDFEPEVEGFLCRWTVQETLRFLNSEPKNTNTY